MTKKTAANTNPIIRRSEIANRPPKNPPLPYSEVLRISNKDKGNHQATYFAHAMNTFLLTNRRRRLTGMRAKMKKKNDTFRSVNPFA